MGRSEHITAATFPMQSRYIGTRCRVVFHYDEAAVMFGQIVRDDTGAPYETIIRLDNGRFVRGAECQYRRGLGRVAQEPAGTETNRGAR